MYRKVRALILPRSLFRRCRTSRASNWHFCEFASERRVLRGLSHFHRRPRRFPESDLVDNVVHGQRGGGR